MKIEAALKMTLDNILLPGNNTQYSILNTQYSILNTQYSIRAFVSQIIYHTYLMTGVLRT